MAGEHVIEKTTDGFICTVCTWKWKSKPRSSCPGVVRYQWQVAPAHLKTEGQLKKMRLNTGPVRGIVGDYYLFDVNEAIPWTSEEIAAEKERNRRTCTHCGKVVSRGYWNKKYESCKKCLPGAIERRAELKRQHEESLERDLQEYIVQARDGEILWARNLLTRSDWVVLDTETTGLDAYAGDEVISIAVVAPDGSELLNTLIKPSQPIPAAATAIHGITDQMVMDAPFFAEFFPRLREVLTDRLVIAYNSGFDRDMLLWMAYRNQIEARDLFLMPAKGTSDHWEDAMMKYAYYYGAYSRYHGSFTWQPLPRGTHQAAGDCLAVIELIKTMAGAKLSTEEENLVSAAAVPGTQESDDRS